MLDVGCKGGNRPPVAPSPKQPKFKKITIDISNNVCPKQLHLSDVYVCIKMSPINVPQN